jgi:hypothetical protein
LGWVLGALLQAHGDFHEHFGALGVARRLIFRRRQRGRKLILEKISHFPPPPWVE